jgi:subtilisin-like proprotein convertase family protein
MGFRGYTYKSNPAAGDWRVIVKTENEKTIAVHNFSVKMSTENPATVLRLY